MAFLAFLVNASQGQHSFRLGLLPAVNINKKVAEDWSLNLKAESRGILNEGVFSEPSGGRFEYSLTDLSVLVSKKAGLNNSLAGGYLVRFRGAKVHHRFIQQFTIVQKFTAFRLAHRFSADQTLTGEEPLEMRIRYRISTDFPFNGQEVDAREFYMKLNNEYLGAFQGEDFDVEIRIVPVLGFAFNDDNKLEWGLDYRVSSFIDGAPASSFWLAVSWFLRI